VMFTCSPRPGTSVPWREPDLGPVADHENRGASASLPGTFWPDRPKSVILPVPSRITTYVRIRRIYRGLCHVFRPDDQDVSRSDLSYVEAS
jgi:hypothetical protein